MKFAIIKAFTVLWLLGMYAMLVVTFLVAYQSPQKAVIVSINQYGEAQLEFFMLTGAMVLALVGTLLLVSDIRRDYLRRAARRELRKIGM